MIRSRPLRWLMVGFGLLCLAVAPLAVAEGNLVVVLALVPFGAMLLGMGLLRPPAKGTAEGICYVERPVRGTAFTIARRTAWMLALVLVGFTLVGIAILAAGQTVIGVLCVAFFGGIGATKIPATLRGESHPILTPDGIHQHRTFVPWDAIEGWSVREHRGTEILALEVDRSQVSTTRGERALFGLNRLFGGEVGIALSHLAADGELLIGVLKRVLAHPEDRGLLASPGGPDAVRRMNAG